MSDPPVQRLGSIHLEDMAIVALTSRAGARTPVHPDLDEDRRARLRSRLKQIGRHDWPANLQEDPLVRRGYTLRQCLRLVVALMLVDAHLAPSFAIAVARANEGAFIRVMVDHIAAGPDVAATQAATDLVAVLLLGELVELVAEGEWHAAEPQRVRFTKREQLADTPSDDDFAHAGQRLTLEIGTVAAAVWRWLLDRRLMTSAALEHLAAELAASDPAHGYVPGAGPSRRR